jgi:hypothetical protein
MIEADNVFVIGEIPGTPAYTGVHVVAHGPDKGWVESEGLDRPPDGMYVNPTNGNRMGMWRVPEGLMVAPENPQVKKFDFRCGILYDNFWNEALDKARLIGPTGERGFHTNTDQMFATWEPADWAVFESNLANNMIQDGDLGIALTAAAHRILMLNRRIAELEASQKS